MKIKKSLIVLIILVSLIGLSACDVSNISALDVQTTAQQSGSTSESTNAAESTAAKESPYGDTGGLELPIVKEPVTITWMLPSDTPDLNEKDVMKEIYKRTGVKLDIQSTPAASFKDKMLIVIASGKLPDITNGIPTGDFNILGEQGALARINDYIDILPNFKKLYVDTKENNWALKSYANINGDMFTWPVYNMNRDVNHGFLYRKDIFDKNGIKMWSNTDEFYQAIKKLKEIYPNSCPVLSKAKEKTFNKWMATWGMNSENGLTHYDEETNSWEFIFTTPEYKDMLDFMKKLYNEGLLDPEFLTCTTAAYNEKITADDQGFVAFDWIGVLDSFYNQVKDKNPDFDLRFAVPIGPTGKIAPLRKITDFGVVVAKNERTETSLKLLDYLTSPSGSELITLGIEGVHFQLVDNKPVYPGLAHLPTIGIKDLEINYGCWLEPMYVRADRRSVYYNFTEKEQEAQDLILNENRLLPYPPLLVFTEEEFEVRSEYETSLLKASEEFSAKYVMDKSYGEAEWNEWLKNAERLNVNEYVNVYNTAQKRYDSK